MIFLQPIDYTQYDRMSSITRVLHPTTWIYFTSRLPDRFIRSPKVVKEAIMADINNLVQEFWRTSSEGAIGASLFAVRRLFEILQECLNFSKVCFDIISVFVTAIDLADKNLQRSAYPYPVETEFRAEFKALFDGYRKMFDQSCSKSKDLGDILRFLPGVVVQNTMSIQGMAALYRIKQDLLMRLIKSTVEPLRPSPCLYKLDQYLSCFLQDQNRSQLYYCDPILQHVFICRQFLSLMDGSNAFDFQS